MKSGGWVPRGGDNRVGPTTLAEIHGKNKKKNAAPVVDEEGWITNAPVPTGGKKKKETKESAAVVEAPKEKSKSKDGGGKKKKSGGKEKALSPELPSDVVITKVFFIIFNLFII